jgi:hypothetical protein
MLKVDRISIQFCCFHSSRYCFEGFELYQQPTDADDDVDFDDESDSEYYWKFSCC